MSGWGSAAMLYLLHFDAPLGDSSRPHMSAQHYLGFADDVAARIAEHQAGRGAAITAACVARGIGLRHVATFDGDRTAERRAKRNGHFERRCPVCKGAVA